MISAEASLCGGSAGFVLYFLIPLLQAEGWV
jgi:hypothetical protein